MVRECWLWQVSEWEAETNINGRETEASALTSSVDPQSPLCQPLDIIFTSLQHKQILKYLILKIIKRNTRVMNVNMQGEGTYCMEWIALIDWNLEVSLELIKSCNLQGGKGKEMTIWSIKYRDNNRHILLWKLIIILSSAAWLWKIMFMAAILTR